MGCLKALLAPKFPGFYMYFGQLPTLAAPGLDSSSSAHSGCAGSSPASRTKSLEAQCFKGFFLFDY